MTSRAVLGLGCALALGAAARSQDPEPAPKPAQPSAGPAAARSEAPPGQSGAEASAPRHIQWYATWAQGKAEAARLRRPILLLSAAPQCHGISGLW